MFMSSISPSQDPMNGLSKSVWKSGFSPIQLTDSGHLGITWSDKSLQNNMNALPWGNQIKHCDWETSTSKFTPGHLTAGTMIVKPDSRLCHSDVGFRQSHLMESSSLSVWLALASLQGSLVYSWVSNAACRGPNATIDLRARKDSWAQRRTRLEECQPTLLIVPDAALPESPLWHAAEH